MGLQENVEKRVDEDFKTCGALKVMFHVRKVRFGVKKNLNERVMVPTVMCEAET